MSLRRFDIVFDNPCKTYYGGQLVTGKIILHIIREKKIRELSFRLRGEAEVKWSEDREVTGSDGKSSTETDWYKAHELYVNVSKSLVESADRTILPPGQHVYPFSCRLPSNIPSSIEASYGHVRYTIKARIYRPWKFDHTAKAAFTVVSDVDLNLERNILEPIQTTKEHYKCCCCCRSGPVTLVVNVLRGYVPGQKIEAVIECDNLTGDTISIKCYLQKTVTFRAKCGVSSKTKTDVTKLVTEDVGVLGAHGSHSWVTKVMVPSTPPSYLKHCNCIDVSYDFVVKGILSGGFSSLKHCIPVVIGTIPLRNYFPSIVPSAPTLSLQPDLDLPPSFDDAVKAPSAPPMVPSSPYPDMPPPSYAECVGNSGNIRNEEDDAYVFVNADFSPRYPVFNFK